MDVRADFRSVVRGLLRSKGFAVSAALTLALGIAATTTIFSVVYGVLLRPLPYPEAGRLVVIQGEKDLSTGARMMNYSPIELEEFAAAATAFSSIAISSATGFTSRSDAGVEQISGATVSAALFSLLGVPPRIGRTFADESEPVVVISDRLRRRLFGATDDGKLRLFFRFANSGGSRTAVHGCGYSECTPGRHPQSAGGEAVLRRG